MKRAEAVFWLIIFTLLGLTMSVISPTIKVIATLLALFGSGKYKQYGINVWEGHDNATSAELGGDPDDSISSRLGKARNKGSTNLTLIANKVDLVADEIFNDKDHCNSSIELSEGKKKVLTY